MRRHRLKNKGVALFIVLGTILVVVILANITLNIMLSQSRLTQHEVSRIRAYYAGLAGMNLALTNLRSGAWLYGTTHCLRNPANPNHLCTGIPDIVNDQDIPYEVHITINPQGQPGNPPDVTGIDIDVDYTSPAL